MWQPLMDYAVVILVMGDKTHADIDMEADVVADVSVGQLKCLVSDTIYFHLIQTIPLICYWSA